MKPLMPATEDFKYDVFLSHSGNQKPKVLGLVDRLKSNGLRVRSDEYGMLALDIIGRATEDRLES